MNHAFMRFLSLVMSLVLVLSLVPAAAFAAETETNDDFVAINTATGVTYTSVSEACDEAQAGQTIQLTCDFTDDTVVVDEETKLDLAGHQLTADYVASYGDIIDSSEGTTGLLTVPANHFMLETANSQLPVTTEEGYRFVEIIGFNTAMINENKYAFQPLFEADAHRYLSAGGVSIQVNVSWLQNGTDVHAQFSYTEELVNGYIASYNATTGKYGKMFTLTKQSTGYYASLGFEAMVISDTDVRIGAGATYPDGKIEVDSENKLVNNVTVKTSQGNATIQAGTQLEDASAELKLTTSRMDNTGTDITLSNGEQLQSFDVHVSGISADNTVPVIITLNELAPEFLNKGNLSLYHVENGVTVPMTRVYTVEEVDTHNEYYYDIATGTVTLAMSTFSEVATVSDTEKGWEGGVDHTWYDADADVLYIANADQLWSFSQIVGGMAEGIEQDSFSGKTVKLIADINLGDKDNASANLFYPIGYYNEAKSYTKPTDGTATAANVTSFQGTFDGQGHTIANFYQNTWQMWGDYDGNNYKAAMGLFGYVVNGTVKNLTVDNFSSDGEFTPTGVIAAYAVNSTFENISLTNCNPRVYNTGNGGIIGVAGRESADVESLTLKNITIDNSNKISALWGSWDVACGGLVGMYRGNADSSGAHTGDTIYFENCHVSAQIDVYNDVCANYQYYAYRYSGMMIGSVRHNTTDANGRTIPNMAGISAKGCTVHFGDWNDYYYCELVANTLASYTHDHQMSRLTQVASVDVENMQVTSLKSVTTDIPTSGRVNYVVVAAKNDEGEWIHGDGHEYAACYHFVNGVQHFHDVADNDNPEIWETVNGIEVLKEDKQLVYREFNNLFTGYGWGVSSKGITDYAVAEIKIMDREEGNSVAKFDKAESALDAYSTCTTVTVGQLFAALKDADVEIVGNNVQVFVSPVGNTSAAGGTYVANTTDWTQGTLTFSGTGAATITITDYYFCVPYTITINLDKVQKFAATTGLTAKVDDSITMDKLFSAIDGIIVDSNNVTVTVNGAVVASGANWESTSYSFKAVGDHVFTITDGDCCIASSATVTVAKGDPSYTIPTGLSAIYGDTLADVALPSGFTWDDNTLSVGNAGENSFNATYTPADTTNYNTVQVSVVVTVDKAQSEVTVAPVAKELTYNKEEQPLVEVGTAEGGEIWYKVEKQTAAYSLRSMEVDEEGFSPEVPTATNAGTYTVYYKIKGDSNHNDTEIFEVPVTVNKATPVVTVPTVNVTYGDTLENATLEDENLEGTLTWNDDTTTSVGNAGNTSFTATYVPNDPENYVSVEIEIPVVVEQAEPEYEIPTGLIVEYGKTLADVALPDGFAWEDSSISVGEEGTNSFTAIYTPADTTNYKTVEVSVDVLVRKPVQKFKTKFTGDFLYRVGNANTVSLGSLFTGNDVTGAVTATIDTVTGASGTYTSNTTWTNGTIQFSGTGVVKLTITDNDYCTPTVLYLEVVDAINATTATDATSNNVVLLNNIGSGFTVSGRYTVYGNGFTLNYTGNGQYLNNGLKQGVVTVSENGTLDNLRIVAPVYPSAYMYYSSAVMGEAVTSGPVSTETTSDGTVKNRYHYQLSAVAASGNATISNCCIYGGRNNIFINTGDVTVKNSILECGTVANVQIQSNASHTVTFEDVATIQYLVDSNVSGTTAQKMLGAGVLVGPETNDNPTIVLNGSFKQYNWVTADDKAAVSGEVAQKIIQSALDATEYNHTINGKTASNLGIIYMNEYAATITDNTDLPYVFGVVSISSVNGKVYSLQGATGDQIYIDGESAGENAAENTVNGLYQPQFKYSADLGGQYIANTDGCDEYCYREGDAIKVMFPTGDTKELDLAALVNIAKYSGQDLCLVISCKDGSGEAVAVTDGKITLATVNEFTVTYTVTDTLFYDKDGNDVTGSYTYSWDVTLGVSLKNKAVPNAYYEFDSSKQTMGYAKKSVLSGGQTQYLPFLAGLKIYDYVGQEVYLRFDGDNDFNKIASAEITGYTSANHVLIKVTLTDGGVINIDTTARAASGGSTYTGKLQTSGSTLYYVNDGTTSATTTTWVISNYSFIGNNGATIDSGAVTFANCENGSVPTGSFSTTINYTVTYDANGGSCGQTTGYATSVSAAVTLPTPTRNGYFCTGWFSAAEDGEKLGDVGASYTPSGNVTLYAQWSRPYTVTYNANGGSCETGSDTYTGNALTLPAATRDGYGFAGWYDAPEDGEKLGDAGASFSPSSDITLYAQWQDENKHTVTYNANGGSCGTASELYEGTALTLPTPTRTGYKFMGWYTATSGGTKIGDAGASYTPEANITLYAQWTGFVVTYNANSGSCSTASQTYAGTALTLPTPTRSNYTFNGWYTAASGGTKIGDAGASYTPTADITLYAQWSRSCVTPDTLITMADGTQKQIQDVRVGDEVLAWNFYTGQFEAVPVTLLQSHETGDLDILHLYFEDGTELKILGEHGVYDADLNTFVFIDQYDVQDYIGHNFVKRKGDGYTTVKLIGSEVTTEHTTAYTILSYGHYNVMAEGMFTVTPAHVGGNFFNPFEVGEDMKYDEAAVQADIEKYGLYTYEDFAHVLTYEQFVELNIAHFKVSVGKGYVTYDGLVYLIENFINNEDFNV